MKKSVEMSNCKASFDPVENSIWAGHVVEDKSFPSRQEGFFRAREVVASSTKVEGYIVFPEHGRFEYQGSMSNFLTMLKAAGGARATLQIPGLTHWLG
jgi:hypothetical protein